MEEYSTVVVSVFLSGLVSLFLVEVRIRREQSVKNKEKVREWEKEVINKILELRRYCEEKAVSSEIESSEVYNRMKEIDESLYKLNMYPPSGADDDIQVSCAELTGKMSGHIALMEALDTGDPVKGFRQLRRTYEYQDFDMPEQEQDLKKLEYQVAEMPKEDREVFWEQFKEDLLRDWMEEISNKAQNVCQDS